MKNISSDATVEEPFIRKSKILTPFPVVVLREARQGTRRNDYKPQIYQLPRKKKTKKKGEENVHETVAVESDLFSWKG